MGWACGICQIWKYVNWMLAYICVRISLIKRASSGPPCCFGVVRLVLSIHDKNSLSKFPHNKEKCKAHQQLLNLFR